MEGIRVWERTLTLSTNWLISSETYSFTYRNFTYLIGENTLVVLPERMTTLEAVNTVDMLTSFTTELIELLQDACGSCEEQKKQEEGCCPFSDGCNPDECPFEDADGPDVELSDAARRAIPLPLLHIAQSFLSVTSDIHPTRSFHFLTPFQGFFCPA